MRPLKDNERYSFPDALGFEALEFLERSRDVASEVVVDGARETSTSRPEEAAAIDPWARLQIRPEVWPKVPKENALGLLKLT
jgi:hypothetical protein